MTQGMDLTGPARTGLRRDAQPDGPHGPADGRIKTDILHHKAAGDLVPPVKGLVLTAMFADATAVNEHKNRAAGQQSIQIGLSQKGSGRRTGRRAVAVTGQRAGKEDHGPAAHVLRPEVFGHGHALSAVKDVYGQCRAARRGLTGVTVQMGLHVAVSLHAVRLSGGPAPGRMIGWQVGMQGKCRS